MLHVIHYEKHQHYDMYEINQNAFDRMVSKILNKWKIIEIAEVELDRIGIK